jgi:hypothetical protein
MLAALAVVMITAACGGGGSGKAQPAPLVEKSSAIAAGDAVCKSLSADIGQLVSTFKSSHASPSEADARDFLVNTLLPRIDRADGDIHRIGEPTKDRSQWDDAVSALDRDVSALKAAVGKDAVKVVTSPIVVFDKSAHLFTDYGFKECGKTTSAPASGSASS